MELPFTLPPIHSTSEVPVWKNNHFRMGNDITMVLQYHTNENGWNDALTLFHEETAGDQHVIDRASRYHAGMQLKKNINNKFPTILEIGCSSGFMLQYMQQIFPQALVMGADIVTTPLLTLSQRMPRTPLFQFDLLRCPLPDQCLDAVVMLNVLEHIEDDEAALKQVFRILKPGGVLVLEVPAGPHLYDIYDKHLMHYRRYTLAELRAKVKKQLFSIKYESHLGVLMYPGFWWVKKRNQRFLTAPEVTQRQIIEKNIQQTKSNLLLHGLMQLELFLGRIVSYPAGIRAVMTCVR